MALVDNDLANLSLDEEEDEGFQFAVEEGPQQPLYDLCLVGCALTASVVNFLAMKNTMTNLWHPLEGIQISELGEKRYLFRFFYEVDLERRASITSSVWLREDNIGSTFWRGAGKEDVRNSFGLRQELGFISHTLGLNLKGEKQQEKGKGVIWQSDKEREDMVKDMEEIPLENEEGKKRFRDKDNSRMERVRQLCGFNCCIDVLAMGTRGGLSIGWKSEVAINLRSFSKHHIDINIEDSKVRENWRLTSFYGAFEARGRSEA
ncbi:hypothetical protein Goarm_000045 [Gossypium armourianum]|uniref:DUF4283 domain-containing protein n=1 Tax=Gossypium armourianum TaxID=34283 RepID=A0A7J9KF10_9ROSI|nr:hypothetical protein [Gossypium armourianum]